LEQLKKSAEATSDPVLKGKVIELVEASKNNITKSSLRQFALGLEFSKNSGERRRGDQAKKTQQQSVSMTYNNSDRNSNNRRDSKSEFVGDEQRRLNPNGNFSDDFNLNGEPYNNNRNGQQQPLRVVENPYHAYGQYDIYNRSNQYEYAR
jgi:hypothetical protein